MADKNTKNASPPAGASAPGGFKGFNATGRDDTANIVLRPQVDAAVRQRAILLVAFALLLLCVVGYIGYSRSHLSLTPTPEGNGPRFGPGNQQVD